MWMVLILGLVGLYFFLIAPQLPKRGLGSLRGWDYAHRGLWNDTLPENSAGAFRAAVEHGFGMETDIHITRDDALVVFHDDDLMRMCGVNRRLSDCTLAELRQLHLKGTMERIPTFDEFLEIADGKVPLIIELKSDQRVERLCELTAERLDRYPGVYCIESFDPRAVRWWRRHRPEILRGQLAFGLCKPSTAPKTWENRLCASLLQNGWGRPDFVAFEAETDRSLSMRMVRIFRPSTVAWTVRNQAQMNTLRTRYDLQIFEGFLPEKRSEGL